MKRIDVLTMMAMKRVNDDEVMSDALASVAAARQARRTGGKWPYNTNLMMCRMQHGVGSDIF